MPYAEKIVVQAIEKTGSTWITQEDLEKEMARSNTGTMNDIIYGVKDKFLVSFKMGNGMTAYSTRHFHEAENKIAENVMRLQFVIPSKKYDNEVIDQLIDEFEEKKNSGHKLHYHQRDAVKMVCNNNFSVLTGGPGTGKTTVLSAITYCLRALDQRIKIIFTAPTGKAARRITESTGEHASTVHKKLNIGNNSNLSSVFYEDAMFIDESSMNDIELSNILMKSIPDGRKIVFVGDVDQLPSVGPGAVLRDLIASNTVPVTMLTHTFRQDNNSKLFANICNIRNGIPQFIDGEDFHSILLPPGKGQEKLATQQILSAYQKAIKKYGIDKVVVLVPYRKKKLCSNSLNNQLQQIANPGKCGYQYTNQSDRNVLFFKKNDFVMQLVNRDECANGDVGQVISSSAAGIKVKYTDATVSYTPDDLGQLALAYSMTIHKSQGSEYQCVIMCFLEEHKIMLQRNLIYTGITRAKKECIVIYQQKALEKACKTIADANRFTLLKEKLQDLRAQYRMIYGI